MLTRWLYIFIFLVLSIDAYALHRRCQSNNSCFYNTPLWSQGDNQLEEYVGNQLGIEGYEDQGLCVPTSAAILLKGVLDERHQQTKLNSFYLHGFDQRSWHENVYMIGMKAKTNFEEGGTWVTRIHKAYKDYFNNTKAHIGFRLYGEGLYLAYSDVNNEHVINKIKNFKYGYLIGVDRRVKKTKKILGITQTWYDSVSGHALVIRGYYNDNLQIHDPWGYIYYAKINREHFKRNRFGLGNMQSVFKASNGNGNGNGGWMNQHNKPEIKLVLKELIGISLD